MEDPTQLPSDTGGAQAAADEEQPSTFPIDFEEWASARRRGPYRFLVAGYRHAVRQAGRLTEKRDAAEWTADFDQFCAAPAATVKK